MVCSHLMAACSEYFCPNQNKLQQRVSVAQTADSRDGHQQLVCRLCRRAETGRRRHPWHVGEAGPPLHLFHAQRSKGHERAPARQLRRYRCTIQYGGRHLARHPDRQRRSFREDGHSGRRPHCNRQRHRHRRCQDVEGGDYEAPARS